MLFQRVGYLSHNKVSESVGIYGWARSWLQINTHDGWLYCCGGTSTSNNHLYLSLADDLPLHDHLPATSGGNILWILL